MDKLFAAACEIGDIEMVQKFLEEGITSKGVKNSISQKAMNLGLKTACGEEGNLEMVKFLVENGADPKINEPIIYACIYNHLEIVKFLLSAGADPQAQSNNPLTQACNKGYFEIVKVLMSAGAKPDKMAIICACGSGNFELVKTLVEAGADIRVDDNHPIVSACMKGNLDIVKYLVEHGADPTTKGNAMMTYRMGWGNGQTLDHNLPIFFASEEGHYEIVKYLITVGADWKNAKEKHRKMLKAEKLVE